MEQALVFERHRGRLFAIAYGIVKNADDAEDLVQETAVRWLDADVDSVRAPGAWLVTTIRRLAIDWLRRTTTEQRVFADAWVREPLAQVDPPDAEDGEQAPGLVEAWRTVIERLGPDERVAFVLREVFGADYGEVARALAKSETASRQIVHRARKRVRGDRSRFALAPDVVEGLVERCLTALAAGRREPLLAALTAGLGVGTSSVPALLAGLSEEHTRPFNEPDTPESFAVPVESDRGMAAGEIRLGPRVTGRLPRAAATVAA